MSRGSRELTSVFAAVGVVSALMLLSRGAIQHWTTFYRELLDCAISQDIEPNGPVLFWSTG